MTSDRPETRRRSPKQARSRATWDAIVEAASQILERQGPDALNTNDVAERAGVSIGTLYQYFPDKHAILAAAARRELATMPVRQQALVQALIALAENLGRFGAASGVRAGRAQSGCPARKAQRGPNWDARVEHLQALLIDLLVPARPALIPIPVRTRRR